MMFFANQVSLAVKTGRVKTPARVVSEEEGLTHRVYMGSGLSTSMHNMFSCGITSISL